MKIKAYAKINLTLDVTGIRSDGYHELHTVFQPVSLHDTLTIEPMKEESCSPASDLSVGAAAPFFGEGIRFTCTDPSLSGGDNLVVKAYQAVRARFPETGGVSVRLEKRIPVCAGLGGGSADAAAMIRGLNEMFGLGMSMEEMISLGVSLGADVPTQLLLRPAVGEGIGEVLTPVGECISFPVVLFLPDARYSTPEMYRRLDAVMGIQKVPAGENVSGAAVPAGLSEEAARKTELVLAGLREGCAEKLIRGAHNVFEKAVPDPKAYLCLRERLLSCGFSAAVMSGSGPAVFCLAETEEKSRESADGLRETLCRGERMYVCTAFGDVPADGD